MRPVKLKIKGLNSFIDIQEIDFSRLTSKGLFGIFGPTGSGKSTILDGITLALYGAVARGSSNYMNTNCEALNVSFEFQISEKEMKKYRVDREFRRDKRTGNVRTHSAKILQLTEAGELVLEEQVREVTKKCEEIIGLKIEDFTRTVVLPQGKFSEFLRLEGKERREMLERLFNLQKYGDELSSRLMTRIRQEQEKANHLSGQLKSYEDCSEEILQEKTKELTTLKEKLTQDQQELKKVEEDFNNGKEVWDLQTELSQHQVQKTELEQQEANFKASEIKANLGEKSLRVKPYLDQYEDTLGQIATSQEQVAILVKDAETLASSKKEAETQLAQARFQKDNELPALKLREQSVSDAIEEKKKLNSIVQEKSALQATIQQIEKDLEEKQRRVQKGEEYIAEVDTGIQDREKRVEALQVDQDFKGKINEALLILSRSEEAAKHRASLSVEIKTLQDKIQEAKDKGLAFSKELEAKLEMLQASHQKLQKLIEACPGDQDKLIALQEKLSQVRDQWNKGQEYSAAIEKSQGIVEKLTKEQEVAQQEKERLEQEISELEKDLKKIETQTLAHALREALVDGEACPVCGSKHHQPEAGEVFDTVNLEQLQATLSEKKSQEKGFDQALIKTQESIKLQEKYLQECREKVEQLGEEYKAYDLETLQKEFDNLRDAITQYNTQKSELEEEMSRLSEEKNELVLKQSEQNTIKTENAVQLENRIKSLELVQAQLTDHEKDLTRLKAELGVEDFKREQEEITAKENEKVKLEGELKGLREKLKTAQELKGTLTTQVSDLKEALKESTATLKEKEKNIQEKISAIKAKVGEVEDLEAHREDLLDKIAKIDQDYAKAETIKNQIEHQYNECHTRLQSAQNSLVSLVERSQKDKESLEKALREEQLNNIDEAKSHLLSRAEIDRLKEQIKNYQDSLTKLAGAIGSLKKKIGDRSLTEEQWDQIQKTKEEKTTLFKELEENKIKLEANVKSIAEDLVQKKELLKTQAELERQLGLLKDLEKLFKGKKFVEYVAAHQLKYVSIEAGKRLKEITGGNYGLEVDENGRFLIRDYKNGGAQRDASTLSGGETFLASLSLALALSAQIQLKGTAPLELFFLDEGFGTLDDNLLEVVMDSLEKIHHDKLSVGIISHVESIKNRVPVKLMVTPAKAGMGGSKVGIEVS